MAGVTPFGFEIKSLEQIRVDLEAAIIAEIGTGFDMSLDTPQGQIAAVISDAQATLWELAQDVHASFDLRSATGARLDALALLRNLPRIAGETDVDYRTRLLNPQNVSEQAVGRIRSAVSLVQGVTRVLVNYNDTGVNTINGLNPLTVSVAVEGGDDLAVARAISDNMVFGLGLIGNEVVNVETSLGICRSIRFIRPKTLELQVDITTNTNESIGVCNGTSVQNVQDIVIGLFNTHLNQLGQLITTETIKAFLLVEGIAVSSIVLNEEFTERLQLEGDYIAEVTADTVNVIIGA